MNPALLTPSGLPRGGLVAWHDLYFPNIALQSETLDNATWTATNVTVADSAEAAPVTGMTVHSVTASADGGTLLQTVVMPLSTTCSFGIWLKRKTGTGNVSIQTKAGTATVVSVTSSWQFLSPDDLAIGGAAESNACGLVLATNGDAVYATGFQCYPSATLPPYAATTTLQAITDLSGKGNTLTRGSNASAADTNDPTVLGPGLGFVDDDFAMTGVISGVTVGGPLTIIVAGKHEYDSDGQWASLGNSTSNWACFYSDTATSLKTSSRANGAGPVTSAAGLTIVDSINYVLALTSQPNGVLTLTRLDNMASVSGAENAPLTINPIFTLGSVAAGSYALNDGTLYESLLYSRVLTAAELQRIRRYVKSKWAARGVVIS